MKSKKKQHDKKSLNKLRKDWYDRLKAKGFIDIEYNPNNAKNPFNDHSYIKNDSAFLGLKYNYFTAKYYEITRFLGDNATFLSNIDAKLLKLHGNGYTLEKISNYLRKNFKYPRQKTKRKRKPYSTFWVYNRLKTLKLLILLYAETECMESVKKTYQLL